VSVERQPEEANTEAFEKREEAMLVQIVRHLSAVLRDERGVETLEWILIGGLIVGVGIALYPGVLQPALSGVITTITGTITAAV
jgi:Flp pilus assembly pilin Flp